MTTTAVVDRTAEQRRRELARIHVAKKELGMERDAYEAMLLRVANVTSSADLDRPGRLKVLDEMERLGARTGDRNLKRARYQRIVADKPQNVREELAPMIGKVGALLADSRRPWAYAHGMAKKMFGVTRVEWLRPDQLHRLVSAMQTDANRRAKRVTPADGATEVPHA